MPHPLTPFASDLKTPAGSAASLGYHMPAEWASQRRVWLVPPHNPETWPGCLEQAQAQFDAFMRQLARFVDVATTPAREIPTNDSWIRDFGPIFVVRGQAVEPPSRHGDETERHARAASGSPPRLAAHDFRFNGWGGKYEQRDLDDVVPQHIARELDVPLWIHDMVLEGGSIDVNGLGSVMTTEQCLLNPNRNPHLSKAEIERRLHDALGTRHVIWLPGGIIGDDTDGHIDDIARFVAPDTVVAVRPPSDHPDAAVLGRNWELLQAACDQDGRPLRVVSLPAPQPILYDFPPDRFGPGGVNPVPASYANFLIANRGVLVPVFGQVTDDEALAALARELPEHEIVPIRAETLVVGLGALHCLSQQEPATGA